MKSLTDQKLVDEHALVLLEDLERQDFVLRLIDPDGETVSDMRLLPSDMSAETLCAYADALVEVAEALRAIADTRGDE